MTFIADLLFQAAMLKKIPRSGYAYLGVGLENVAEHSFITAIIGYVFSQMVPEANAQKLITMCLLHDLTESYIGDLNYVQRRYVTADTEKAIDHLVGDLPFGHGMGELIREFENRESLEAKLAYDADQIALILDLKALRDVGHESPKTWIPSVAGRLLTETGKEICAQILNRNSDAWWRKIFIDTGNTKI